MYSAPTFVKILKIEWKEANMGDERAVIYPNTTNGNFKHSKMFQYVQSSDLCLVTLFNSRREINGKNTNCHPAPSPVRLLLNKAYRQTNRQQYQLFVLLLTLKLPERHFIFTLLM